MEGPQKPKDQQVAELKVQIKNQRDKNAQTREKTALMGGGMRTLRVLESQLKSLVGDEEGDRILLEINRESVAE